MRRTVALLGVAVLAATACRQVRDIGKECVLVKRDPTDTDDTDGIRSVPVKESEIRSLEGKDYVSFGATECEDLVCIRSADVQPSNTPGADAKGYCSRPCIATAKESCLSYDDAIDKDAKTQLTCRPLILDEQTVGRICSTDPAACDDFFASIKKGDFCARAVPAASP